MRPLAVAGALFGAGLLLTATPVLAHHAVNSQFDVGKTVPMTGTLVKLDNINPHAYWHFAVKNAGGSVENWTIESLAPGALRRAGVMLKEDIRPGDTYSFTIAPPRQKANNGLMTSITVNGKTIPLVPK